MIRKLGEDHTSYIAATAASLTVGRGPAALAGYHCQNRSSEDVQNNIFVENPVEECDVDLVSTEGEVRFIPDDWFDWCTLGRRI